jgi:hypothetical protein
MADVFPAATGRDRPPGGRDRAVVGSPAGSVEAHPVRPSAHPDIH